VHFSFISSYLAFFIMKLFMELDENLTSIFATLSSSLSEENIKDLDFLLRVNSPRRWPRLEPVTARAILTKMMELGMWKVDVQLQECRLSPLISLLDKIGRRDLSVTVQHFGQ